MSSSNQSRENSDEEYEILDVTDKSSSSSLDLMLEKVFGDITKASAAKQLLVGGGTGWLAGFLCVKVGKAAAVTLGVTAFAFQVAQYNGLIEVNWTKVKRLVHKAQNSAQQHIQRNSPDFANQVKQFYRDNMFMAVGFSGGFLTGFFF